MLNVFLRDSISYPRHHFAFLPTVFLWEPCIDNLPYLAVSCPKRMKFTFGCKFNGFVFPKERAKLKIVISV